MARKEGLKNKKSERKEQEKEMLRERIAALKKETSALESQLKVDSGDDIKSKGSTRSLPDSSEYQKLLQDLTKESGVRKNKGNKGIGKKCAERKEWLTEIQRTFLDKKGKIKVPTARELKQLVSLTEASSKSSKETKRDKGTNSSTEDSTSDSTVDSSTDEKEESSDDSIKPRRSKAKKKKKGKLVSGRLEKVDEMDIVKSVKYPHSKLSTDFVTVKKFDKLPFHHLVAGELEVISRRSCGEEERQARLGILKYLAYHFAYLDTMELREQYDAIMKRVERGELRWNNNLPRRIHKSLTFRRETIHAERQVTDGNTRSGDAKAKKVRQDKSEKSKKEVDDEVVYCADYNRGKCEFSTSHMGKWSGREVMKLHICKRCLVEDGVKRAHTENDDKCPKKA